MRVLYPFAIVAFTGINDFVAELRMSDVGTITYIFCIESSVGEIGVLTPA